MRNRNFISNLYKQSFSVILLAGVLCGVFSLPARANSNAGIFDVEQFGGGLSNRMDFLTGSTAAANIDVQIPNCPDASGVLRGKGKMIITETKSPAPTQTGGTKKVTTTEFEITGYVNDAAELTHFDMAGTTTETDATSGGNVRRITVAVEENKIGDGDTVQKEIDRAGRTMFSSDSGADAATVEQLSGSARTAITAIFNEAAAKFRAARSAWRSGACVEVKLTAPKTILSPGEKVVVTAESLHKTEKVLINAKLVKKEATASATPDNLPGTPSARFTLTAPGTPGQKAMIAIESISKRGIGTGKLEFDVTSPVAVGKTPPPKKLPPVKTPPVKRCTSAWTGKITVVKRERKDLPVSPSGRLVRHVHNREETFNIEYNLVGEQDTTQGFTNGYFAEAQTNYHRLEYEERNYAADKMGCNNSIIMSPETKITEILMNGSFSKRLTVYITAYNSLENKGILTFDSPQITVDQIITRTYKSNCPSYDKINSGVDRNNEINIPSPGFEIEIPLDAKSNYQLTGSKTIENSDGSETLVTWNLTRNCN